MLLVMEGAKTSDRMGGLAGCKLPELETWYSLYGLDGNPDVLIEDRWEKDLRWSRFKLVCPTEKKHGSLIVFLYWRDPDQVGYG